MRVFTVMMILAVIVLAVIFWRVIRWWNTAQFGPVRYSDMNEKTPTAKFTYVSFTNQRSWDLVSGEEHGVLEFRYEFFDRIGGKNIHVQVDTIPNDTPVLKTKASSGWGNAKWTIRKYHYYIPEDFWGVFASRWRSTNYSWVKLPTGINDVPVRQFPSLKNAEKAEYEVIRVGCYYKEFGTYQYVNLNPYKDEDYEYYEGFVEPDQECKDIEVIEDYVGYISDPFNITCEFVPVKIHVKVPLDKYHTKFKEIDEVEYDRKTVIGKTQYRGTYYKYRRPKRIKRSMADSYNGEYTSVNEIRVPNVKSEFSAEERRPNPCMLKFWAVVDYKGKRVRVPLTQEQACRLKPGMKITVRGMEAPLPEVKLPPSKDEFDY